jgi:hypothetical protein
LRHTAPDDCGDPWALNDQIAQALEGWIQEHLIAPGRKPAQAQPEVADE